MDSAQLDIFDALGIEAPARAVDDTTASILRLIDGDPIHERDRATIVEAILRDADEHGGLIDPNRVRPFLSAVYPRCIGATYRSLCQAGVIEPSGWAVNEDHSGRNAGRPMRTYRRVFRRGDER